LSNENSKLCTSEKSNYLTNNTVPSGGPRLKCVQYFLLGRATLVAVGRVCCAGCMGSNI